MRKLVLALALALSCLLSLSALAAEEQAANNGMDWEISMQPKPSAEEQEAARWSIVLENNVGIYAYDMDSLTYSSVINGVPDKNIISVLTKTVFTDKDILKHLNEKFKSELQKKEKAQYCEILMTFNLAEKTYGVQEMNIFGSKKTLLQHQVKELQLAPVPADSFAEAMLEICQQAALNEEQAAK